MSCRVLAIDRGNAQLTVHSDGREHSFAVDVNSLKTMDVYLGDLLEIWYEMGEPLRLSYYRKLSFSLWHLFRKTISTRDRFLDSGHK